jgi:hypothetical protein
MAEKVIKNSKQFISVRFAAAIGALQHLKLQQKSFSHF